MSNTSIISIIFRLIFSMIVGTVIGINRERAQRAAGFRTHFLVAVGSATAMLTGEYITIHYSGDISRIASQVVSGVGFLGAGTIMKDGASVRGLTTAASLWVTACLGIAAGAGFFQVTILGLVSCIFALTLLEKIEQHMPKGRRTTVLYELTGNLPTDVLLGELRPIVEAAQFELRGIVMHSEPDANNVTLALRVGSVGVRHTEDFVKLCGQISLSKGVTSVSYRLS